MTVILTPHTSSDVYRKWLFEQGHFFPYISTAPDNRPAMLKVELLQHIKLQAMESPSDFLTATTNQISYSRGTVTFLAIIQDIL